MAFEGLIQGAQAVVTQSARVLAARERQSALGMTSMPVQRRQSHPLISRRVPVESTSGMVPLAPCSRQAAAEGTVTARSPL
jgi:hypothetical protein